MSSELVKIGKIICALLDREVIMKLFSSIKMVSVVKRSQLFFLLLLSTR